jgi:hypothetical protein
MNSGNAIQLVPTAMNITAKKSIFLEVRRLPGFIHPAALDLCQSVPGLFRAIAVVHNWIRHSAFCYLLLISGLSRSEVIRSLRERLDCQQASQKREVF